LLPDRRFLKRGTLVIKKRSPEILLVAAFLLLTPADPAFPATSQIRSVFGPESFIRTTGATDLYTRTFTVPSYVAGPYTLHIQNGEPDGQSRLEDAISSGTVSINGVEIVHPSDFNQKVAIIERTIDLETENTLTVTLNSAPDSFITVTISGIINLGSLGEPRSGHTAVIGSDGSVLIAGGENGTGFLSSAERFDPLALSFSPLSSNLGTARSEQTATAMADQRHLLTAGQSDGGTLFSAELFNPVTGWFEDVSDTVRIPRSGHSATMLLDGRVLIVGGHGSPALESAEIFNAQSAILFKPSYDPSAGSFVVLPNALSTPRWDHTATLLPDGRVLIIGGRNDSGDLDSAELFDPALETFTPLSPLMTTPRAGHTATLLPDGRILILGGQDGNGYLASAEVFDLATLTFSQLTTQNAPLTTPRTNHTATLLHFGEILITGGENSTGILSTAELYGPPPADETAPAVVAVTPPDGATDVDLTEIVGVRFSEPVDVTTLNDLSLSLTGSGTVDSIISPSEQGLLVFIVPRTPLSPGTTYTITLTSAITDTAGNPLIPFTSTFTTVGAPVITSLTPNQGPIGTAVTISGEHFDPSAPTMNVVKFEGVEAIVTSATATQLETSVPSDTPIGPASVTVTTRGGTASAVFTVEDPVPIADAGPDQIGYQYDTITLDGSGSYDPNGDPLTYQWTILFIPPSQGPTLSDPTAARPTFVATGGTFTYYFQLTVSDGTHTSLPDTVAVQVIGLASLVVTPRSPTILVGETQAFTATATFVDGTVRDVTHRATWHSSNPSVATIDSTGLATGLKGGMTLISAIYGFRPFQALTVKNPAPVLTALSPDSALVGSGSFTLTVTGANFVPGSLLLFNNTFLATTYVSNTQLTASIPDSALTTAGPVAVLVYNSSPGGGLSNALNFVVQCPPNPAPSLSSISPSHVLVDSPVVQLTIEGSNFIEGSNLPEGSNCTAYSVVYLGDTPLYTVYHSSTKLVVTLDHVEYAYPWLMAPGQFPITVVNSGPGGGPSNSIDFSILPNTPEIQSISPNRLSQGSVHRQITITGTQIRPGASVEIVGEGTTLHSTTGKPTYTVGDSRSGGIPFFWREVKTATTVPVVLGPCDNCVSQEILLDEWPFSFQFPFAVFGEAQTIFTINSNGLITFDLYSFTNTERNNTAIPNTSLPNLYLAPFWDDLVDGSVYLRMYGSFSKRLLAIQWDHTHLCCDATASDLTFEILLDEKRQTVTYQYRTLSGVGSDGRSATVGIEGADGSKGVSYLVDGAPADHLLTEGLAITFTPDVPVITLDISVAEDAPLGPRDLIITNPNGTSTTVAGAITIIPNPITLSITSPISGSLVNQASMMVQGTVTSETGEVGVIVNGVLAQVNGDQFVANEVPLVLGENTLTATATDFEGSNLARSVTVTVESLQEPLRLLANPVSGIAPLAVEFSILLNTNATIISYSLDADGDGIADFTDTTLPETIPFTYSQPGLYMATLTLTDDQGNSFTDTLAINVLSASELDASLKNLWVKMRDALRQGNVEQALAYFTHGSQERYRQIFEAIGDQLITEGEALPDISLVILREAMGKYRIHRTVTIDGQTVTLTYWVYFILDTDGIWRIRQF
jgi:hypothetical protein